MKILITGANGQLGMALRDIEAYYPNMQFSFLAKEELNITNLEDVAAIFKQVEPDYCINCAAYTAVDKAETERETAFLINQTGVKNLAKTCAQSKTRFVHISTDYVFDGSGKNPYKEDHFVRPQNVYGESKLMGEKDALKENSDCLIIRTSWVYSEHGSNFVKTMLRLMQSRPEIGVVVDQEGCPTYAGDLAKAILFIISSGKWVPGIYHYSNEGIISWFDFAKAIQTFIHSSCQVNAIPSSAYPTPAKRPAYSVLDKKKIKSTFGITIPDWKESLHYCLNQLKKNGAW